MKLKQKAKRTTVDLCQRQTKYDSNLTYSITIYTLKGQDMTSLCADLFPQFYGQFSWDEFLYDLNMFILV